VGEPVEVWISSSVSGNGVTLYLTHGALKAAEFAFSPVPVAGTCTDDTGPLDAELVLDGRVRRAMGVEEARQALPLGMI
jgi:hypothetical protein